MLFCLGWKRPGADGECRLGTFVDDMTEGRELVGAVIGHPPPKNSQGDAALRRYQQEVKDLKEQTHIESDAECRIRAHRVLTTLVDSCQEVAAAANAGYLDLPDEGPNVMVVMVSHANFMQCWSCRPWGAPSRREQIWPIWTILTIGVW